MLKYTSEIKNSAYQKVVSPPQVGADSIYFSFPRIDCKLIITCSKNRFFLNINIHRFFVNDNSNKFIKGLEDIAFIKSIQKSGDGPKFIDLNLHVNPNTDIPLLSFLMEGEFKKSYFEKLFMSSFENDKFWQSSMEVLIYSALYNIFN